MKKQSDNMPTIWPWLTDLDTKEFPERNLVGWLQSLCLSYGAYREARGAIVNTIDVSVRTLREELLFSIPSNPLWERLGMKMINIWNLAGEDLGYTEWASPEEGDGRIDREAKEIWDQLSPTQREAIVHYGDRRDYSGLRRTAEVLVNKRLAEWDVMSSGAVNMGLWGAIWTPLGRRVFAYGKKHWR